MTVLYLGHGQKMVMKCLPFLGQARIFIDRPLHMLLLESALLTVAKILSHLSYWAVTVQEKFPPCCCFAYLVTLLQS